MSLLPRLILISGWAHDSSAMEDLRKCLVSAVDVSSTSTGNLWSAETETCSQSSYAQNLGKMIEKTGSRAFIAGWSLGGMIALETAAYWPDLIAGLILISSTAKFRADQNWAWGVSGGALRAMTSMLKHNPRGVFATFFKNVAHTFEEKVQRIGTKTESRGALWRRREETIALKIEKACAMNPLELSAGLEYLSEKDLRNEATKVNIPALILHGKQDAIIPVEAGLALKSLFPVSQIRVYENCGHGLPWQNPQTAAEDIIKFIEACANKRAI
jgi:pimeloyl-[acyl-carrier protein] methyl ester esterase